MVLLMENYYYNHCYGLKKIDYYFYISPMTSRIHKQETKWLHDLTLLNKLPRLTQF